MQNQNLTGSWEMVQINPWNDVQYKFSMKLQQNGDFVEGYGVFPPQHTFSQSFQIQCVGNKLSSSNYYFLILSYSNQNKSAGQASIEFQILDDTSIEGIGQNYHGDFKKYTIKGNRI